MCTLHTKTEVLKNAVPEERDHQGIYGNGSQLPKTVSSDPYLSNHTSHNPSNKYRVELPRLGFTRLVPSWVVALSLLPSLFPVACSWGSDLPCHEATFWKTHKAKDQDLPTALWAALEADAPLLHQEELSLSPQPWPMGWLQFHESLSHGHSAKSSLNSWLTEIWDNNVLTLKGTKFCLSYLKIFF